LTNCNLKYEGTITITSASACNFYGGGNTSPFTNCSIVYSGNVNLNAGSSCTFYGGSNSGSFTNCSIMYSGNIDLKSTASTCTFYGGTSGSNSSLTNCNLVYSGTITIYNQNIDIKTIKVPDNANVYYWANINLPDKTNSMDVTVFTTNGSNAGLKSNNCLVSITRKGSSPVKIEKKDMYEKIAV
jgi:aspartate 1-decarboxylase